MNIVQSVIEPTRVAWLQQRQQVDVAEPLISPEHRPWVMVLHRDALHRHIVARFRNRQDASTLLALNV